MKPQRACAQCLRRPWLLAALGPYIEAAAARRSPHGAVDLLRLSSVKLAESVAPDKAANLIAAVDDLDEGWFANQLAGAGCWAICRHDEHYPSGLADPTEAPWALIGRGDITLLDDRRRR